MSKASFWQRGEALDFPNTTESKIEANTVVVIGKRIGVIGTDIAPGATGTVHVQSVFSMPKEASVAFAFGDELYWDKSKNCLTKTTTGGIVAGYAAGEAEANATTALVKLLG